MSLILVSNRLPVSIAITDGNVELKRSAGGLATALRALHEKNGEAWIGSIGDVSSLSDEQKTKLTADLTDIKCISVDITVEEMKSYYDGFSNGVLWPLFHYQLDRIPPSSQEWESYRKVNEKFATAAVAAYKPGDMIWVHDYQLMLVPQMIRELLPDAKIGFFLHIPFPVTEVLRTLPWRKEILQGMLGADLIGFHTFSYRSHFATSIFRLLNIQIQGDCTNIDGRKVCLSVFPINIDVKAFEKMAADPEIIAEVEAIKSEGCGDNILLGIDRLDYSKGIPQRLTAYERFLELHPEWHGKVRFVQVAVPSRDNVPSYIDFTSQVDELVGRINGRFSTVDWVPIHYIKRSLTERQVVALYLAANVMLVTPLRDGMNLVAKEFVACRLSNLGVLVLSEFAGAAEEMVEALQVNPYDIEAMAQAYFDALNMSDDERRIRMHALRKRNSTYDVHQWAQSFIDTLGGIVEEPHKQILLHSHKDIDTMIARLRNTEKLLLLLDYDGTLVPFASSPELAAPDFELKKLLMNLSHREGTCVHVISGRSKETIDRWLGDLPIGLHAEHGLWSRMASSASWEMMTIEHGSLPESVKIAMDDITLKTPGSLVETKSIGMAWHWRMVEPELGLIRSQELWDRLETELIEDQVDLLKGDKVMEVRPHGVHKGRAVERILAASQTSFTAVVAMGDDSTDNDMFRALPSDGISIAVGSNLSIAKYRIANPKVVRDILKKLIV